MYSVHIGKMYMLIIRENVHVQLSGKMCMYNYSGKCTCTIIQENVHVQLSLLGLSGGHIGDRISLNAIPATLNSIMTISHKINTMTSFDTEARKDGSLLPPRGSGGSIFFILAGKSKFEERRKRGKNYQKTDGPRTDDTTISASTNKMRLVRV